MRTQYDHLILCHIVHPCHLKDIQNIHFGCVRMKRNTNTRNHQCGGFTETNQVRKMGRKNKPRFSGGSLELFSSLFFHGATDLASRYMLQSEVTTWRTLADPPSVTCVLFWFLFKWPLETGPGSRVHSCLWVVFCFGLCRNDATVGGGRIQFFVVVLPNHSGSRTARNCTQVLAHNLIVGQRAKPQHDFGLVFAFEPEKDQRQQASPQQQQKRPCVSTWNSPHGRSKINRIQIVVTSVPLSAVRKFFYQTTCGTRSSFFLLCSHVSLLNMWEISCLLYQRKRSLLFGWLVGWLVAITSSAKLTCNVEPKVNPSCLWWVWLDDRRGGNVVGITIIVSFHEKKKIKNNSLDSTTLRMTKWQL